MSRRQSDAADGAMILGIGCVMFVVYVVGWLIFIALACLIVKAIFL